jgi:hypothetical protein
MLRSLGASKCAAWLYKFVVWTCEGVPAPTHSRSF